MVRNPHKVDEVAEQQWVVRHDREPNFARGLFMMTGTKIRSIASAIAITAVSAFAYAAPGSASAAGCTGANIEGNGASVEKIAQVEVWTPAFNLPCKTSDTEQVAYDSTSASKGLESWWVGHVASKYKGFGPTNAFVATDGGVNPTQTGEILEKGPGATVLSIPVLQWADALPIHLPEGCTAESGKKGSVKRLTLSDATLQGIFAHTITTWEGVPGLVGASCDKAAPITRVVRKEGAGATGALEKFLFEINKSQVDGTETWNELAEEVNNTKWPAEGEDLVRAEKGSGIATAVASTAGSIGYANLGEVRQNTAFTPAGGGGEGSAIFWPELQSKGTKAEDPSTDGESDTPENANCAGEDYISLNGSGKQAKFPPASTEDAWNEVTASIAQKKSYPLCDFAYIISLTKFSDFLGSDATNEPTSAEVETLKSYVSFVVGSTGQSDLDDHDFLELPSGKKGGNVLAIAQAGAAKIGY
jgi:ABC-type phosphate transport system substrate-binding protein